MTDMADETTETVKMLKRAKLDGLDRDVQRILQDHEALAKRYAFLVTVAFSAHRRLICRDTSDPTGVAKALAGELRKAGCFVEDRPTVPPDGTEVPAIISELSGIDRFVTRRPVKETG